MLGRVQSTSRLLGNVHTSSSQAKCPYVGSLTLLRLGSHLSFSTASSDSVLKEENGSKIKKMHSRKIRLFNDNKSSPEMMNSVKVPNNLAPRVGKTSEMAFDELSSELPADSEDSITRVMIPGVPTYKIKATYIEPPKELQFPVSGLTEELRPVLVENGPVPFMPMYDTPNFLDLSGRFHTRITQPTDVNWDSIPPFVTASRDSTLVKLGLDLGAGYMASTSSLSGLLSQQHFALTCFAPIQDKNLSPWFKAMPRNHTRSATKASSSLVRKRMHEGKAAWGVDNYPSGEPKQNQILIDLGKSLERHLTFTESDFNKYFVLDKDAEGKNIANPEVGKVLPQEEAHSFVRVGKLFLRSQLDCEDQTVPNNKKVFDLKTRATLPIRMDIGNHESYVDYKITQKNGLYNSFEREFYDMCRTAFLKYSFQCRIGDMGGVLVAYHNTLELFGMEYISLSKMDEALYGDSEKASFVYKQSIFLTEKLLDYIIPENSGPHERDCFRLTIKAYNGRLHAFVETIPDIDCNNAEVLDNALADFHTGVMYVDRLTREQCIGALQRRGLSVEGSLPELLSRLEGHVCPSDFQFKPRTVEELLKVVEQGRVKMYQMNVRCMSPNGNPLHWKHINDADRVSVSYNVYEKKMEDPQNLASLYNNALNDYVLYDARAEKQDLQDQAAGLYDPAGDGHIINVGSQNVHVTSTQFNRMRRRKEDMMSIIEESRFVQDAINNPDTQIDQVLDYLREKKQSLLLQKKQDMIDRAQHLRKEKEQLMNEQSEEQVEIKIEQK